MTSGIVFGMIPGVRPLEVTLWVISGVTLGVTLVEESPEGTPKMIVVIFLVFLMVHYLR